MLLLTVNSGSTSTKLAAFESADGATLVRVAGENYPGGGQPREAFAAFARKYGGRRVVALAHRVVHGGTRFTSHTRIDAAVEDAIRALAELAPLHNPVALHWIDAARQHHGTDVVQVAAFDTVYFARLPRVAAEYALPPALGSAQHVRRYGFHGLAHEAMSRRWAELHPQISRPRLITLQLGGGCSAAAIRDGQPMDTSMGFSPLEGLVMATRSGDVDPSVVPYLARRLRCSDGEIVARMNRESGLLGVSGRASDMSVLVADSSPEARLAVEMYCYRARKCVGAYLAALGGCDGVVFGGGVGEHVPEVRAGILRDLAWAGIALDERANAAARGGEARISDAGSRIVVHVIAPDEERALAEAALGCLRSDD